MPAGTRKNRIGASDMEALRWAFEHLEHPSLAARLTALVGTPLEEGLKLLPQAWYDRIREAAESSIERILGIAIGTLPRARSGRASDDMHKIMGMSAGAVGGFFGLPGVLIELPVTTGIIMRSIADIAADEGEDLTAADSRLACVEVFALGGRPKDDDAAETGYYGLRLALAFHFSLVSHHLVEQGAAKQTLPMMVSLVRAIAARFGIAVSDKVALQLVPVVGAAGGALLNAIFLQHFQHMARGHFIVRRLERQYGAALVRRSYEGLGDTTPAGERPVRPPVLRSVK
jgi:hypothetical protein